MESKLSFTFDINKAVRGLQVKRMKEYPKIIII